MMIAGQARKSLWIETANSKYVVAATFGQARKSLWIETSIGKIKEERRSGS